MIDHGSRTVLRWKIIRQFFSSSTGQFFARTIPRWTILHPDNSSLKIFAHGQFFARTILRPDNFSTGQIFHPDNSIKSRWRISVVSFLKNSQKSTIKHFSILPTVLCSEKTKLK
jgi:hypothetical protein